MNGEPAGDDPWDAWTLEWATTSPPPTGNFPRSPGCAASAPCSIPSRPGPTSDRLQ